MIGTLVRVYRESGVKGIVLRSVSAALRRTGRYLPQLADRIDLTAAGALAGDNWEMVQSNRALREKHKGQRCFVIGNGPSLATQDLSCLAGDITFVMNAFWKHPILEQWQPTYYCIADPLLFDGSEPSREFFRSIRSRVHDSTFFVPLTGAVRDQGLLPLERTHFVGFRSTLAERRLMEIDLVKVVPGVINVSQLCIMVAIYMGCSPIYLLGLDHDWLAHRGSDRHFYAGGAGLEKHHGVNTSLASFSYKELMESQLALWVGYEKILELATRLGIKIFNATNGGFLDVFERVSYESVEGL